VGQHQEADRLVAEIVGSREVLDGDVRLCAVGGDARDGRSGSVSSAQILDRADTREQQNGDLRPARFVHGRGDQRQLVRARETVVERRATQPVAVGHLDDLDTSRVERMDHGSDLTLVELVLHGMAAIAQRRVGDTYLRLVLSGYRAHAVTSAARVASSSPTRAAAAVMMSRLPAHGGR